METPSNGRTGNKTRSYIFYAIGEVTLVVIGILIALQVNNWNEQRLDQQREVDILLDLNVEFEANITDLRRAIKEHKIIYSELQTIQRITLSEQFNDDRLDSLMHAFTKWFTFTDRPGASTNLINSGNLNLISNDELRDLITQWPGMVNDIVDDEAYVADMVLEGTLSFLAAHYPISNLEPVNENFLQSLQVNLGLDSEPVIPQIKVNWKEFLSNKELQSHIAIRKIYELHCIAEGQNGLKDAERIQELIQLQLSGD